MTKLEEIKLAGYGQLAFYAHSALKSTSSERRDEYVRKIGVALCVLNGVGLIDDEEFIMLQDMRYSDLESCFEYVNDKSGGWYEI